jgi:GntR family transcriptional regulator
MGAVGVEMVKALKLDVPVARVEGRNPAVEAYRILQDALTIGQFAAGTRLPGERSLAAQLGVSRVTLRQVLTALADAGRIHASPQRGWFVADHKLVHEPNRLRGFTEVARESGLEASARIVRVGRRFPTLSEAGPLGIDTDQEVVDLERVRELNGSPISVEYSCISAARVPGLDSIDLTDCSLYQILRERYDIVAMRCDYELQAEGARRRDAELLAITEGDPVLVGYQMTYDQHEQCFDIGKQVYRGDAYRFKASLFRF